jgi:CDP-diacylglycerol--serine O-phosphatidyltransferase
VNKIAILPTLLTLGNAVCGFASIAFASKIKPDGAPADVSLYFGVSGVLILVAMVFDALDGYAARLSRSASEFGGQLDSLCDAISFGLAPAFLLLRLGLPWGAPPQLIPQAIAVIAALYLMCAILRLARFNVENTPDAASHKRFKGLPSPAAAGCIASLALLRAELPASWLGLHQGMVQSFVTMWAPLGGLLVALLMVSRLPYPHFNRLLRRRRSFAALVQAVLFVCLIMMTRELACFLIFWIFALNSPVRYAFVRLVHGRPALPGPGPGLDDVRLP